jgi:type I restriction enzyme S subunit
MAETLRLGDHCVKIGSGATPRGGKETYLEDGPIALIRSQNVHNDRFSHSGLAFISHEQAAQLQNVEVKKNDVLLNITGDSVARSCQVDGGVLPARVNQHVAIIRPNPKHIDPRYLRYFLAAPFMQAFMLGLAAAGATRNALTKSMIEDFRIPALEIENQRAIASTLGALDDKIDLNRRVNDTLEAMARAIFKDWFVDFGPTRAKMEGRAPYLAPDIWVLFPKILEASKMGAIPAGWRVAAVRELTRSIQYGLTQSAKLRQVGPRFLRITDIQSGKVDWSKVPFCEVTPEEHERYRLRSGDILVARTGASTGENIFLPRAPEAVFASYLVRFQFPDLSTARLVGSFMRSEAYFDYVAGCIGGSAQPNASAQLLAGASLVYPTQDMACKFNEIVSQFDAQIEANNACSETLAATRDLLLPKLMSGEIRVKDAAIIAETAL